VNDLLEATNTTKIPVMTLCQTAVGIEESPSAKGEMISQMPSATLTQLHSARSGFDERMSAIKNTRIPKIALFTFKFKSGLNAVTTNGERTSQNPIATLITLTPGLAISVDFG